MPDDTPSPLRATIGDTAPTIVDLTEQVLFGDVRERPELGRRGRSMVSIASLVTGGNVVQLEAHTGIGRANGQTEEEIIEDFTRPAFSAGRPEAPSAIDAAQREFAEDSAA